MKGSVRPSLFRSKRSRLLLIIILALIIAVVFLTHFVIPALQESRGKQERPAAKPVVAHSSNSPSTATPTMRPTLALSGNQCGVRKNNGGSYSYSWLHVDTHTGYISDEHNCIVDLRGFEFAGLEYGNGTAGLSEKRIAWFNQTFHMNYVRLPLNASWWNNDVFVPTVGLHYRVWIEQVVRWAEKYGDYVLLNKVVQFPNPPCGGNIISCPSQATPANNPPPISPEEVRTGPFLDATRQLWQTIVPLYANDPAVLYDQWNELHDLSPQTWQEVQNELIATIRALNPRSLIMLGGPNWNNTMDPVVNNVVQDFTQSNLVYDWHVYNGYNGNGCSEPASWMWTNWGARANRQIAFAQVHGHGAAFNEWGGCNDFATYNKAITSFALANHVALSYYQAGAVANRDNQLTANGLEVQAAYARFP